MGSEESTDQNNVEEKNTDAEQEPSVEASESLVGDVVDGDIELEAAEATGLVAELEIATARADENWEKLLLAKAEVENVRRRSEKDVEKAHRFSIEKFAKNMLPVIDSLEMGLLSASDTGGDVSAIKEGMELTHKQLLSALEKSGIQQVDPVGSAFNPEFHQAMSMVPSPDHEPNVVIEVFQKGYTLNSRLLRPAMVIVSQAQP